MTTTHPNGDRDVYAHCDDCGGWPTHAPACPQRPIPSTHLFASVRQEPGVSLPYSGAAASQTPPDPIFVGLDLSLTSTGVAIIRNGTATVRRITSKPTKNATTDDTAARLDALVADIIGAIPASDATLVAVEGPSYGSTGTAAHILGGLWWIVRHALRVEGLDVVVVPPTVVKKYATGKGNAPKDQVLAAVVRRYTDVEVTGNDEADALVLAAIRARGAGHPFEASLPQAQADAATAVSR